MPHYVKVAWGLNFWRVFLLVGRCSSLTFYFYRLKPIQPKVKRQWAAGGLDKKRDKNLNGGAGVGRGRKDRGSFSKYL